MQAQKSSSENSNSSGSSSSSSGNRMLSRIANFLMGAGGTEDGEVDSSAAVAAAASNNNLDAAADLDLASAATMAQPIPCDGSTARLRQIEVEGDDWILVDQHVDGPSTTATANQQQQAGMDESWYVTPPACFTQPGPVHVETSPLEDLLIEHPSMSVYRSASSEASLGLHSQHPRVCKSSKQQHHRQRRMVPKSMVVVKAAGAGGGAPVTASAPASRSNNNGSNGAVAGDGNDNNRGRLARMAMAPSIVVALPPRLPLTARSQNIIQNHQQHNQQQLMHSNGPIMEPKLTHRQRHHHHHTQHQNHSHHHNQQHNTSTSPHRCNNQSYNGGNNHRGDGNAVQQVEQQQQQQQAAPRRSSVKDLRSARGDENLRIIQMRSAQKMLEKRTTQSSKRKCLERGNKVREVASTGKARRPRRQDRLRLNNSNANNNRKC